jgi:hypothetical protein
LTLRECNRREAGGAPLHLDRRLPVELQTPSPWSSRAPGRRSAAGRSLGPQRPSRAAAELGLRPLESPPVLAVATCRYSPPRAPTSPHARHGTTARLTRARGPATPACQAAAQLNRPVGPVRLGVVVSRLRPTRCPPASAAARCWRSGARGTPAQQTCQ